MYLISVYTFVTCIAAIVVGYLAWYVWMRRDSPGGFYFALFMAACALWSVAGGVGMAVSGLPAKTLCLYILNVAAALAPVLWFLFALDYSQKSSWLRWPLNYLIWLEPAIVIALTFTNQWHGLFWSSLTMAPTPFGDIVVREHGVIGWINVVFVYLLMLAGFGLILWSAFKTLKKNYLQSILLVLGACIALGANFISFIGLGPWKSLDFVPIVFPFMGIVFAWGIFRESLFDLVPNARYTLVQSMGHGLLVLDESGAIADVNPAARRMLDSQDLSRGMPAEIALSRWPQLADWWKGPAETSGEIRLESPDSPHWVDARVSFLYDSKGRYQGRVIALWDVTRRKESEDALILANTALKTEVDERRRAEGKLEISLREKEVLLKEIHHRVKNNLQIVSSLLSLQTAHSTSAETATDLIESQNRIKSMALIHEKLYRSRDFASIGFRDYVESLLGSLSRSYVLNPNVRIVNAVDSVTVDIDTAIPCGLIINELVSNSLKYAFKGSMGGEVRVSMAAAHDRYTLTVSDDGSGTPPGWDFRNTPTLGMQLVVTLTGQLGGEIELQSEKGTTFKITFKKTGAR